MTQFDLFNPMGTPGDEALPQDPMLEHAHTGHLPHSHAVGPLRSSGHSFCHQHDLFADGLEGAGAAKHGPDVLFIPGWLSEAASRVLMKGLVNRCRWFAEQIPVASGVKVTAPRLIAYQGDTGTRYTYSGIPHDPDPWTDEAKEVLDRVHFELETIGVRMGLDNLPTPPDERFHVNGSNAFNSVLVNRYRDGSDSMGWHSDSEIELGHEPIIASVSLGATRTFEMKHKLSGTVRRFELSSGCLLVMGAGTQGSWVHRIPKEPAVVGERVNLTFRRILSSGALAGSSTR